MLSKFLSLDEFITPGLIRPFYLVALGLIGLSALIGVLNGIFALDIKTVLHAIINATLSFIGIRLFMELFLAVFRLHDRFVGGHPKDGIPE